MKTLIILVVFWSYNIQVEAQRCPVGWLEIQEGTSCYRFWPTRKKSWQDARATCQSHDGDLLKLDSFTEKDWIINQLNTYPSSYEWWIGLRRDPTNETSWVWVDQTMRRRTSNFLQWGSGEPNNYQNTEDCAEIWDNLLNDKNCDYLLQFVCERQKDLPMTCDVDDGWNHVTPDRCYKVFSAQMSKTDAINVCKGEDGELLTIQDEDTQHKISDFLDNANKLSVWLPYIAENATAEWKDEKTKVTDDWWSKNSRDSSTIVENATLCSVLDSGVTSSNKNWRPVSCNSVNSVLCSKPKGTCPSGFIQHKSMCYLLKLGEFMTWNEARSFCSLRQTTLLEIKDDETWFFMSNLFKKQYDFTDVKSVSKIWLGITVSVSDFQTWTWLSDSKDVGAFEKKLIGSQSSSLSEKCIYVDINTSKWIVGNCANVGGAVCTLPVNTPMVLPPNGKDEYKCEGDAKLHDKFCYEMITEKMDWYNARWHCGQRNSDLVTIMSEEELFLIRRFWQASFDIELWIGLNDQEHEGTFTWLNTGIQPRYTNWMDAQPNNAEIGQQYSENCAVIYLNQEKSKTSGKWLDYPCSVNRGFVCKRPAYLNIAPGSLVTINSARADSLVDSCTDATQQCCKALTTHDKVQVDLGSVRHIHYMTIIGDFDSDVKLVASNDFSDETNKASLNVRFKKVANQMLAEVFEHFEGRFIFVTHKLNKEIPKSMQICEISIYTDESVPSFVSQHGIPKENVPCVQVSSTWKGNISHTVSGRLCQQWSMQSPHTHMFNHHVGNETPSEASNYCRDPTGYGYLWCYTTDPDVKWEICNVDRCNVEPDALTGRYTPQPPKPECEDCLIVGDGLKTWGDSYQACDTFDNILPMYLNEEDFNTDKLKTFAKDKQFWLSIYYDSSKKKWFLSLSGVQAPSFLNDLIDNSTLSQTMCAVGNANGQVFVKSCFERFPYLCAPSDRQVSFKTSSNEGFKDIPSTFINKTNDNINSIQFKYKGYDGATILIQDYTIRIGGNLFAKSYIADKSESVHHSTLLEHLCSDTEYKAFWVQWSMAATCFINVGLGSSVGQNVFLQYTNCPDTNKKDISVSVGTVMKTSKVYTGFWKFSGIDVITAHKRNEMINVALVQPAKQSSNYRDNLGAELAVDGCELHTINSGCVSHTQREDNPWWEVDLERVYPIKTIVVVRRWEESGCCRVRLGYFQVYVSMFSGSTHSADLIYASDEAIPPKLIYINGKGKHGRYIRIVVPRKQSIIELAEVKVFEDIDASRCGPTWVDDKNTGICYKYSDIEMTWDTANEYCKGLDAQMVIPRSASEQLVLYDKAPLQTNIWLGINRIKSDKTFATSDDSKLMYTNWAEGEPTSDGVNEGCAVLGIGTYTQSGRWHTESCSSNFIAVCQRNELATSTPIPTTSTTTTTALTSTTTTIPTTTIDITKFVFNQGVCRNDWIFSEVSGSCVKIIKDSSHLGMFDVAHLCLNMKAQLASIVDKREQAFFKVLAQNNGITSDFKWNGLWLGGIDAHEENNWDWFMRKTSWKHYEWAPGQPDNTNEEDCVMMLVHASNYGTLNDLPCSYKDITSGYICQYDPVSDTDCGTDWVYNPKEDSCYFLNVSDVEGKDAWESCESSNSHVATFKNDLEEYFLQAFLSRSEHIWIGAYGKVDAFHWWDGTNDHLRDKNIHIDVLTGSYSYDGYFNAFYDTDDEFCVNYDFSTHDFYANACTGTYYPTLCKRRVSSSSVTSTTPAPTTKSPSMKTPLVPPVDHWKCGAGWEVDVLSGLCYKFAIDSEYSVTWNEAQQKCAEEDGNLVSIVNMHEQAYIIGRLQGMVRKLDSIAGVWIGLTDYTVEHQWHWNDNEPYAFLNWAKGPDQSNATKDCAEIVTDISGSFGLWNDVSCDQLKGYICKRGEFNDKTTSKQPKPYLESTSMIEFYQPAEGAHGNFESHDLFELGVRVHDTFTFLVKTSKDAFILLHKNRDDFEDAYKIIIGGWGDTRNIIENYKLGEADRVEDYRNEMLNEYEFRPFWISWNDTTILVGNSDTVGSSVFLTYPSKNIDINFVSVTTGQYTDAYWKIPKYDKYYGCDGKGWLKYGDSCFLVTQEQKTWDDAVNYCEKQGGDLASIANENEQNFLLSHLPRDRYCFNIHDNDTECNLWAEWGECDHNPVWMSKHCHHACELCMTNCRDVYENTEKCAQWASTGECTKNHPWMIHNCALSCGVCEGAPTRGYWIGLHSLSYEQSYSWNDKSRVRYTNWDGHQPLHYRDKKGSCVGMLVQNGKWNDGSCSDKLSGLICKKPISVLDVVTTISPYKDGCIMDNSYGYGAYCYTFKSDQTSWSEAVSSCESIGGILAHIGDHYTQSFLASEMAMFQTDYWIGLDMIDSVYRWSNNKTLTDFYTRKDTSKTATNGCFAMSWEKPVGLWKLYEDCNTNLPYICQSLRDGFTTSTTPSTTEPLADCPTNWSPHEENCYRVFDHALDWFEARASCFDVGAALVSIHDLAENTFVRHLCDDSSDKRNCWIGINDIDIEGDFEWDDFSPPQFDNWNNGEPNDRNNEDCVVIIRGHGGWNDVPCLVPKQVICKMPRGKLVYSPTSQRAPSPVPPSSTAQSSLECPESWSYYAGSCYKVFNHALDWFEARTSCFDVGAALVSIHDLAENTFVRHLCDDSSDKRNCWIGINDIDIEGDFEWDDVSPLQFDNWNNGEPNDRNNEDCVVIIRGHGGWNDVPCLVPKQVICKMPRGKLVYSPTSPRAPSPVPPSSTAQSSLECPESWSYYAGSCYKTYDQTDWLTAKATCELDGAQLAIIKDGNENQYVSVKCDFSACDQCWIGAHDSHYEGVFQWLDNSDMTYVNWATNEPNNVDNEDCAEINSLFSTWNDVPCYVQRCPLCKKELVASVPTSTQRSIPTQTSESWKSVNWLCPMLYDNLFENNCYKTIPTPLPFFLVATFCESSLLHIHSSRENEAIRKSFESDNRVSSVWIGRFTKYSDGYKWDDGSLMNYNNFRPLHYLGLGLLDMGIDSGCMSMTVLTGEWSLHDCLSNDLAYAMCKKVGVPLTGSPISSTIKQESSTHVWENTTSFETTAMPTINGSTETSNITNKTKVTPKIRIPPFHRPYDVEELRDDNSGLTGGQIGGIVIGVLGLLTILGVVVYMVKQRYSNKTMYPADVSSLGFDNALFSKDQDTVLIK